jgi:hypothetical protein
LRPTWTPTCDFAVGDDIVVQIDWRYREETKSGVITKIVYTPPPGWSDKQEGYTIIQYKDAKGEFQVVSYPHPGLRRRTILDMIVEGFDETA